MYPMGSATGGARGPWPPPPRFYSGGGAVMHLAPLPDFRKNSIMYTINVVFFYEKTKECIHNSVHFIKIFSNLQIFLKNFQNCQ